MVDAHRIIKRLQRLSTGGEGAEDKAFVKDDDTALVHPQIGVVVADRFFAEDHPFMKAKDTRDAKNPRFLVDLYPGAPRPARYDDEQKRWYPGVRHPASMAVNPEFKLTIEEAKECRRITRAAYTRAIDQLRVQTDAEIKRAHDRATSLSQQALHLTLLPSTIGSMTLPDLAVEIVGAGVPLNIFRS